MTFLRVQRKDFRQLTQANLAVFSQLVISKVDNNAVYAAINPQIADLKTKTTAYDEALVAAADRGKELIKLKNIAKRALLDSFELFSNALELHADGNEDYIVGTGLAVRPKPVRSTLPKETPAMPTDLFVKSTGNVGELKVSFKLPNREHVLNVAAEHRIVNSSSAYQNGTYFSREEGLMKNLPSQSMVEVRFRALGRDDLKSEWTTPIVVPVL